VGAKPPRGQKVQPLVQFSSSVVSKIANFDFDVDPLLLVVILEDICVSGGYKMLGERTVIEAAPTV
jgi:hypothetical protein